MSDTQTLPDKQDVVFYGEDSDDQAVNQVEEQTVESTGTQDDATEDATPEPSDNTQEENTEPTQEDGDANQDSEVAIEETDEEKAKIQHRLAVEAFKNRELKRKVKELESSQNGQTQTNQSQPTQAQQNAPQQASSNANGAPVMPKLEDFEYDEAKYADAVGKYHIDAATHAQKQVQAQASIKQKEQEQKTKIDSFIAQSNDLAASDTEYKELVEASAAGATFSEVVSNAILESPDSAKLHKEILSNPERLEQLNTMPPISAMREILKLEMSLNGKAAKPAPPKKKVSQAPTPVKVTTGASQQSEGVPAGFTQNY